MKNLAVLVALPFALVACGDGGSSSSGGGIVAPGTSISSQFIDAPVKGLKYTIGATSDHTGDNGIFPCKVGEEVQFSVHDKVIGTANCGEKIYISDVDPGSGNSTDAAAALIQSLSKTVGGVLDLSTFNADPVSLSSVILTEAGIDGSLNTLGTDLTDRGLEVVTLAEAKAHVIANLPDQSQDSVLTDLAADFAAEGLRTLRLVPLATNPEDHCWENVQVKVKLDSIPKESGTAYQFNVERYLAWDGNGEPVSSPTCDGKEHETVNGSKLFYQCLANPVSKIMTGRSVSGAKYEAYSFEIPQNAVAICQHEGGFEFNYTSGVNCVENEETPILAANALKLDVGQGWNFNITVTNSNYTVNFTENAVDIGAVLNADGKATAYTQTKFNCSYALVEELDPGESLVE